MLNRLIAWLLDLRNIRLGEDAPLMLKWHPPMPAWTLFTLAVLGLAWTVFTYRKESLALSRRIGLAGLRLVTLATLIAVLCRPSLVLQRNRVERSYVTLAIDRSLSMANAEPYNDTDLAQRVAEGAGLDGPSELLKHSRLRLVKAALTRRRAAGSSSRSSAGDQPDRDARPDGEPIPLPPGDSPLAALLATQDVELVSFAGHVETLGFFSSPAALADLELAVERIEPTGASTDLAAAMRAISDRTQGRRLAAIVLASDGQATQPVDLTDALEVARDRRVPVLALRIGSTEPRWDLAADSLRAPQYAYAGDMVTLAASISASGLAEAKTITVRLADDRGSPPTSKSITLEPAQPEATVEFRVTPANTGRQRYRVDVEPPMDSGTPELTVENNSRSADVFVLEHSGRVLYVEGYPRYEYRYLKNALMREPTIEVSVLLLEADEQFVQEGSLPLRRFPESSEELNRFDVVLFGDVDPTAPTWLSSSQIDMLREFVARQGGGFGLIAGERAAPRRFLGTGLEALIPVRIDPAFSGSYAAPIQSGYRPRLTAEGQSHPIFRFAAGRTESGSSLDGIAQLPELYWLVLTLGPKPGASVLLEHPSLHVPESGGSVGDALMPVVVTARYGAGKIFFQATDDTWRWRRHTGEFLHDTYWIQVVRYLMPYAGRGAPEPSRKWVLRTDGRVYPFGATVHFQVELRDPQASLDQVDRLAIQLLEETPAPRTPPNGKSAGLEDTAKNPDLVLVRRIDAHRVPDDSGADQRIHVFEGVCIPPRPGNYVLRLADAPARATLQSLGAGNEVNFEATARLRVEPPDLEARRPQADHDALQRMATATGGRMIELDDLTPHFRGIKDRSVLIPDDLEEPLWDSKLVLILFATMISMEWILRKIFGAT